MSRPLNATEQAAFEARYGHPPLAFTIALDAVAIYVNAANPLHHIGLEQIDAIFSASPRCGTASPIERWGELGTPLDDGEFRDRRIGIYAPPPSSGTRALFREMALCGARLQERAREQPGTRSVAIAIGESHYAIGFGSLSGASAKIRALALPAAGESKDFSSPTADAVRSRRYPFSRELVLYVLSDDRGALTEPVRAFLEVALSSTGRSMADASGFFSLPPGRAREELARLDAVPR
jgi:phosphate transport system substrate-binding protein